MSNQSDLLAMLEAVAESLGDDLRNRLVFVGGCTTALFITDKVTLADVRATDDVDLIADLAGYPAWADLQARLRERGFTEASGETVICRMMFGELKVDFMPDDPQILGFSNRWYAKGIETAVIYRLTRELDIRMLTPELFVATKLEAYLGRGEGDLLGSRDLEDVLLIFDGREEIVGEVRRADPDVRQFITEELDQLLHHRDFDHFLHGNIRGPEGRAEIVRARISALTEAGT